MNRKVCTSYTLPQKLFFDDNYMAIMVLKINWKQNKYGSNKILMRALQWLPIFYVLL